MNKSIELIRIIAVILITFTHTRNDLNEGVNYFIIAELPTYGTAILSIISGYLFYSSTRNKNNLFIKKVKSLAIPYLIANVSVLLLVLIFKYIFGYNSINRLSFDYSLITEGVFSFNSPPINPPTYFIRDIFIIYSIIALFTQKKIIVLGILIPYILFGTLFLRYDIVALFIIGSLFASIKDKIHKSQFLLFGIILSVITCIYYPDYLKIPVSFIIFTIMIDLKIRFFNTGRFSYLLHLYHSPIIVISYPIINQLITDSILKVYAQIVFSILVVYLLFLTSKKFECLKILSGGR